MGLDVSGARDVSDVSPPSCVLSRTAPHRTHLPTHPPTPPARTWVAASWTQGPAAQAPRPGSDSRRAGSPLALGMPLRRVVSPRLPQGDRPGSRTAGGGGGGETAAELAPMRRRRFTSALSHACRHFPLVSRASRGRAASLEPRPAPPTARPQPTRAQRRVSRPPRAPLAPMTLRQAGRARPMARRGAQGPRSAQQPPPPLLTPPACPLQTPSPAGLCCWPPRSWRWRPSPPPTPPCAPLPPPPAAATVSPTTCLTCSNCLHARLFQASELTAPWPPAQPTRAGPAPRLSPTWTPWPWPCCPPPRLSPPSPSSPWTTARRPRPPTRSCVPTAACCSLMTPPFAPRPPLRASSPGVLGGGGHGGGSAADGPTAWRLEHEGPPACWPSAL